MPMNVSQIVDRQIKEWDHRTSMVTSGEKKPPFYPLVTISREYGALGAALAERLGKLSGFEVWDRELLGAIADDLGSDQKLLETLDERRKQDIEDVASAFIGKVHTNVSYLRSLIKVVKTIEEYGRGIIVGRGANYICESKNNLSIRLVRPFKSRVEHVADRHKIPVSEAREMVRKKDKEREEFISRFFYKDLTNASDYDLTINTDTFSLEHIEIMVADAYKVKTGQSMLKVKSKSA
jgi:cytidylate kinase